MRDSARSPVASTALPLVISCEHAGHGVPPDVDLGVASEVRLSQAGWDEGALAIAHIIAAGVGARWQHRATLAAGPSAGVPVVRPRVHAGSYTRLFVDLNRAADHPDCVPSLCYGAVVERNAQLSAAAKQERVDRYHAPYWNAVAAEVAAGLARTGRVLHLSSHSFCPELDPPGRQFDLGVLFDPAHRLEAELADAMIAAARAHGLNVRANAPYSGTGPALCTSLRQRFGAGYAGIELETSHAVVRRADGCATIAAALTDWLAAATAPAPL